LISQFHLSLRETHRGLVVLGESLERQRSVKQGCRSRCHASAALSLAILSRL